MFTYNEILLDELSKNPVFSSASNLVSTTLTTNPRYYSDTEIENMFSNAYSYGEANLNERDRIFLRQLAFYANGILKYMDGPLVRGPVTSNGVPEYTSNIIAESGKSTREFLFHSIKNEINDILPSKFAPYESISNVFTDSNVERGLWAFKALIIPHAYISWLAENKWNLNTTWKPPSCSSVAVRASVINTVPGGTNFGPGTYTLSQLGNPTSIHLYGPLKVVLNRSSGTETKQAGDRIGCSPSSDAHFDNLTGVTSVVVTLS
jgi:hypothetical protein